MSTATFVYGRYEYDYTLLKQNRKTLSLTVDPSQRIIVKAPQTAHKKHIDTFLTKKWLWLEKQLAYFDKFQRNSTRHEYLSGESFYYLGRLYQLVVRPGDTDKIVISKRNLMLTTTKNVQNQKHNKKLVDSWFAHRRDSVFNKRYTEIFSKFNYNTVPLLETRSMPKRWGSYVRGEKIVLNPRLVHAPKDAIDYVIAHELCHMKFKHHNKAFYALLETIIPNWQFVKEELEKSGSASTEL